jgi:hypothetical protein
MIYLDAIDCINGYTYSNILESSYVVKNYVSKYFVLKWINYMSHLLYSLHIIYYCE